MNRELLEQPFPQELIRQRKGNFGQVLDYVEAHSIIHRLNDAFAGEWSFHIIEHELTEEEILVVGKLEANGVVKMAFGSSNITRNKETGEIVSLGDDYKSASTDALKKASTLLGVGLHLYEGRNNGNGTGETGNNGQHRSQIDGQNCGGRNGRLTNRQLKAIFAIARSLGVSNQAVKDDLQSAMYAYALQQIGYESGLVRFDILVKNKSPKLQQLHIAREQRDIDRALLILKGVIDAVEKEAFYRNPSWACLECPFKRRCHSKEVIDQ